jgi:TolA-binding protein
MSASRGPHEPEHGHDVEPAELAQLRRKLDDLSSQQRKSHTAVQQLADSVAALVTAHRRRVRWLNLNSFAAYVIFTVLLGTAFYMVYLRRAGALGVELHELIEQRVAAVGRADAATAELSVSKDRSQKALEVFQLYGEGKAAEAEAKHAALRGSLTPLEDAALDSVRERAAKAAFDRAYGEGLAGYRAGNFAAAVTPFEAAVAAGPAVGPRLGAAHYYLGLCLARTNELPRAKAAFEAALAAQVEIEDARYQLAMVLDRAGEVGKARTEYEKFATGHPKMILAVYAMRRSAVLARWGRAAPPLPGAAPTPAALPAPGPGAAGGVRRWPMKKAPAAPGAATPAAPGAATPAAPAAPVPAVAPVSAPAAAPAGS